MPCDSYEVEFSPTARDAFRKLRDKNAKKQLLDKAEKLKDEPLKLGEALKGDLKGFRKLVGAGRYRIIYRVLEGECKVQVVFVGIRKQGDKVNVYDLLKRLADRGEL